MRELWQILACAVEDGLKLMHCEIQQVCIVEFTIVEERQNEGMYEYL